MIILGIETSCDETAAAVVKDGTHVLSSVVSSQIEVHHPYGGVVPELASRKHIEALVCVTEEAIYKSSIEKENIHGVAVTQGPGLVGALLTGFSFAKAWAFARNIPWSGINHLEGHLYSVFLTDNPPKMPFVALLVSGGHTSIYYIKSYKEYEIMGQTRDDAAGEAFDKVAKMLGLGYPGGGVISRLGQKGNPEKISFPRPYLDKSAFDFSFSGVKTAVLRYIQKNPDAYKDQTPDIAAGFQEAVTDVLVFKLISAALKKKCSQVAIVGGVAANARLREKVIKKAKSKGISVHIPPYDLCGDNAAMIAGIGYHYLKDGMRSEMNDDVYSRVVPKWFANR